MKAVSFSWRSRKYVGHVLISNRGFRKKISGSSHNVKRLIGMITIDNDNYGHYTGEIQFTKKFPVDERVNILNKATEKAIPLLEIIKDQTKFSFTEKSMKEGNILVYAIGIMSGTSLDGVDAALVEITGVNETTEVELIKFTSLSISRELTEKIQASFSLETSNSALISSLNVELGYLFAEAAQKVCKQAEINIDDIEFIASHGQTIYHIPEDTNVFQASTLQIGEAAVIAEETGCTVVADNFYHETWQSVGKRSNRSLF